MAPFDLNWVKRLHREMFGEVWKWAGEIRTRDLNLGVRWSLIDQKLHNLLSDLEFWDQSGMDLVEQAVRLHHQAVQIHPFYNGNGRWSRMLANILLRSRGHSVTSWPENLLGNREPDPQSVPRSHQRSRPGELRSALDAYARAYAKRTSLDSDGRAAIHDASTQEFHPAERAAGAVGKNGPSLGLAMPHFAFMVQYGPGPYAIPKCVTDDDSMFFRCPRDSIQACATLAASGEFHAAFW